MRVITGTAKGRKLYSFTGGDAEGLRPTSAHIKESIFNIIQFDIEGRRVLDLFAGTGQLGIEALSRGAAWVDFVDKDTSVIKKNLEVTGFTDKAGIRKTEAISFIRASKERYDLIFLDPPYNSKLLNGALTEISAIDILRTGGIIVCEGLNEQGEMTGYRKSAYNYSGKHITVYTMI